MPAVFQLVMFSLFCQRNTGLIIDGTDDTFYETNAALASKIANLNQNLTDFKMSLQAVIREIEDLRANQPQSVSFFLVFDCLNENKFYLFLIFL